MGFLGMCSPKVFSHFGHNRVFFAQSSQIGYSFCTLRLNWVCFSEDATFIRSYIR